MKEIDDWCEKTAKEIDEKFFEFLNNNGYKVEKPYTREKAFEIAEQLKRDGKKNTHEVVVDKIVFDEENNRYQVINKILFKLEEVGDENN